MEKKKMTSVRFDAMICMGGGDGGEISVDVEVTAEELKLLKKCIEEDEEIDEFEGLEKLCERVRKTALEENDFCWPEDLEEEEPEDVIVYTPSLEDIDED